MGMPFKYICLLKNERTSKLPTQSNNFYIPSLTPSLVLLYICRHHHHLNRYKRHELTNELWKPVTKFMKEFSPLKKMNSQVLPKCNNLCAFHLLNVNYPLAFTLRSLPLLLLSKLKIPMDFLLS